MNPVDRFSYLLHLAIAEKLQQDEGRVCATAMENLDRWLASPSFADHGRRALLEWKTILESFSSKEIRKLMTAETDEGQRLRSSSPFAGVLTKEERSLILKSCAETTPV